MCKSDMKKVDTKKYSHRICETWDLNNWTPVEVIRKSVSIKSCTHKHLWIKSTDHSVSTTKPYNVIAIEH